MSDSPAVLQAIAVLQADVDANQASLAAAVNQIINALSVAANATAVNQNVLTVGVNEIQAMIGANQAAVIALLTQIVNAVTTPAPPPPVLVEQLNEIQNTQSDLSSGQADLAGLVGQVLASEDDTTSPLPALAVLQTDFDNLETTLNAIAAGIFERLKAIQAELKPVALDADLEQATHKPQKVPPKG